MKRYVTLDLETTGLRPGNDRILEIGAIKVEDGKIMDSYETFVDPEMEIPSRITAITGITQAMAEGQTKKETAVRQLLEFCEELPLLGHNLIFDYSFVKHNAVSMGLAFEKEGMDTLKIAREVLPDLESRSLQYLRKYFQIRQEKEHRALGDANSTYLLYEKLLGRFGDSHPNAFKCRPLICQVKRKSPATAAQRRYLFDLTKYHKIKLDVGIDSLSKNEASKMIDGILSSYGRIMR